MVYYNCLLTKNLILHMQIVSENKPFELKLAAVNGIGLSSSYGHILLKYNSCKRPEVHCDLPMLRLMSTRNEEGIKEILELEKSSTTVNLEYARLVNDTFSHSVPGHLFRGYVLSGKEVKHEFDVIFILYHIFSYRCFKYSLL